MTQNTITEAIGTTVPTELQALPGWLVWRFKYDPNDPTKKPIKMPYYAMTGTKRKGVQGSAADRAQLVTFPQAASVAVRDGYSGVGFAPMAEWGITALDFDKCVIDGQVDPTVQQLVAGTYSELSPSGSGVRGLVLGSLGDHKDNATEGKFGFETFNAKGFVTITGNAITDCRKIAPVPAEVVQFCETRFKRQRERAEAAPPEQPPLGLTPEQIRALVGHLDPSMGRMPWLNVGMAIHHELQGDGFELWDEWSSKGASYPGTDSLECQWDSFSRPRDGGPSVTIRTLIQLANESGAKFVFYTPVSDDEFTDIAAHDRREAQVRIAEAVEGGYLAGMTLGEVQAEIRDNQDAAKLATEKLAEIRAKVANDFKVPVANVEEATKPVRSHYEVLSVWDFMNQPSPGWFIFGVVPKAEVVLMFGASRSGKTFLVLDMAFAIGRGVPWRGIETEKAKVIYLAAEGAGGARKRFRAYAQHNSLSQAEVDNGIGIIDATPNMRDAKVLNEIARCIRKAGGTDILIIDTLAQVIHGDENGEDMQNLINLVREHLCKPLKAMAFFIHHTGKDTSKGARGSSTLLAAVEAEFEVVRSGDVRMMKVTKLKDGEEGAQFGFSLGTVDVGEDEQGRPITSCVVNYTDASDISLKANAKVRGSKEKKLLEVLGRLGDLDEGGVRINTLIFEAMQEIPHDPKKKRDLRRQGFIQALDLLKGKGLVVQEGDKVRPA
jgi:archaellum biogenesis ATPase FlaH